jgi:hypothetical protein
MKNPTSGHLQVNRLGAISTPFIARCGQKIAIVAKRSVVGLARPYEHITV